jgi:hypothetical protein
MAEFTTQGLANIAWAVTIVSVADERLFAAVAYAAELQIADFNMQLIANIAWSFGTARRSGAGPSI